MKNIPIQGQIARRLLKNSDLSTVLTGDEKFLILKSPGRLIQLNEVSLGQASVPPGSSEGFKCTQIATQDGSRNFTAYAHLPRKELPGTYHFSYGGASQEWISELHCLRAPPSTENTCHSTFQVRRSLTIMDSQNCYLGTPPLQERPWTAVPSIMTAFVISDRNLATTMPSKKNRVLAS